MKWFSLENFQKQLMKKMRARPSLEGFSHYYTKHGRGKQKKYLAPAIARFAKDFPDVDARAFLLEYLSEEIYLYEQHLRMITGEQIATKKHPEERSEIQ